MSLRIINQLTVDIANSSLADLIDRIVDILNHDHRSFRIGNMIVSDRGDVVDSQADDKSLRRSFASTSFSYVRAISDEAKRKSMPSNLSFPRNRHGSDACNTYHSVIAATCRPSSARPICIRSAHRHAPPSCTTQKARRSQRGWRHCHSSIRLAISAVHPVWWLAPMPAPLSPWKYS